MTASTTVAPSPPVAAPAREPSPLGSVPYLSALCALSGLAAWLLDAIAIPSFAQTGDAVLWLWIARAGDFASLLAALCGLLALPLAIADPLHASLALKLGKRLPLSGFGAGLLYVVARAVFFEHQETASQQVFLAIGATHMLGVSLASATISRTQDRLLQTALLGVLVMSACGLAGQVLGVLIRVQLTTLRVELGRFAEGFGELGFLVAMLSISLRLVMMGPTPAARLIHRVGLALLGVSTTLSFLLWRHLGDAFPIVLYHAQRIHLFLESAPLAHCLPICFAVAGGLAGLLHPSGNQRQLALCALLFVAAGYNPHAPGRLLLIALGFVLLGRHAMAAVKSPSEQHSISAPSRNNNDSNS